MNRRLAIRCSFTVLMVIVLAPTGCARTHTHGIDVDDLGEVRVKARNRLEFELSPRDERYQELARWLSDNRHGWDENFVKLPETHTYVSGEGFYLALSDNAIFLSHGYGIILFRDLDDQDTEFFFNRLAVPGPSPF